MLSVIPRGVKDARIGRFGSARRHKNSQPINLAKSHLLELLNQQAMMRCRLEAGEPAPFS
jgi:hypothetical protein